MKIKDNNSLHELKEAVTFWQTQATKKEEENVVLKEQLEWLKRQIFGKKSERIVSQVDKKQLIIPGIEDLEVQQEEEAQTVSGHKRHKPKQKDKESITLSPDLPIETVVLDLPEEEKVCEETGTPLVKIGEEISHKLAHKPGSYYIKEIIRPKYAYPQKPEEGILVADLPDTILSRCRADDSFLAEIITRKFSDHLPLYRIAEGMSREGIGISRKLLSKWVIRCGMALKPLHETMIRKILESGNVFIDETPVKLQAKEKCKTAYIWVMVGGASSDPPYRVYDFRENRRHNNALDMLKGYSEVPPSSE